MPTIADLKRRADQALFEDQYLPALSRYVRMLELQPGNLDARLRIGDSLLALGELQRAAVVYTALARHAALAGYPLRALVALKVLSALEPKLEVLLQEIARLYARDAPRVGRSVRRTLPALNEPIDALSLEGVQREPAALFAYAQQLAARYQSDVLFYPDKLQPIPILSLLPEADFAKLLPVLRVVRVRPDTWIMRQGEPGRSFYMLARGAVEVIAEREGGPVRLAELAERSVFGEMVLLSDAPRSASVRAQSDCDLLEFDRDALAAASGSMAGLNDALGEFARERLLANVTATSALFRPLDPKQRLDLVRRFVSVEAGPGQVIIREGDAGTGLYVVLRGAVLVAQKQQTLARLGVSEVFGEISLLTSAPATATVTAAHGGATLLFLGRDYFARLIAAVPELRSYFEGLSEARLLDLRLSSAEDLAEPEPADDADLPDDPEEVEVELLF